jgi:AcrR family transcriptional regulator
MRRKNTTTEMLKDYIAQGLLLLLKNKPLVDISIGEITDKAGVNRSTYYRNFNSKEDIIKFYFNNMWSEYSLTFDKTAPYINHLQKLLTHYLKYKKELLLIYKNNLSYLILDALNDFFRPALKDITSNYEERYKMYWYTGAIYNTVLFWLSNDMKETPEELSKMYMNILSNPFDYEYLNKPFLLNK